MARGDEEKTTIRLISRLEVKVEMQDRMLEDKDKQIDNLNKQIISLQEALVVKEAPDIHYERRRAEMEANISPEQKQAQIDEVEKQKIMQEYVNELGRENYFEKPEDLDALLGPVLLADTERGPSDEAGYKDES